MLDFQELNERIAPPDEAAMARAQARWDAIAKPLDGLGELERVCARIAALTGSDALDLTRRAVVVFCADAHMATATKLINDNTFFIIF